MFKVLLFFTFVALINAVPSPIDEGALIPVAIKTVAVEKSEEQPTEQLLKADEVEAEEVEEEADELEEKDEDGGTPNRRPILHLIQNIRRRRRSTTTTTTTTENPGGNTTAASMETTSEATTTTTTTTTTTA